MIMKPIYAIIGIAALSVAACSRDVSVVEVSGNRTFKAYLETSATTRTAMGEKDMMDKYPVYWSEGDKIRLFTTDCVEGEGREFILTSGAGTAEGVFSGTLPDEESGKYVALYPFNELASLINSDLFEEYGDGNIVTFTTSPIQNYKEGTFDINSFPALAVSENEVLKFKNLGGMLKLNLTGNITVGSIKIKNMELTPLWGTLRVSLNNMQFDDYIPQMIEKSLTMPDYDGRRFGRCEKTEICLSCGNQGVELDPENATSFLFVVPVGSFSKGFVATVYDINGNAIKEFSTTADNSIKRNTITSMPVQDVTGTPSYTDLSANGTANSYIVKPDEKTYRFYAGVKGNSVSPIEGGASVKVMWESNMLIEPVTELEDIIHSVSLDNSGYISFKTTTTPGNAVIALKDANDIILWSWHIWSTNYDPSVDENCNTYLKTGAVLMDRNLGALTCIPDGTFEAEGLRYQWGRKDPFLFYFTHDKTPIANSYPHKPFSFATASLENVASYSIQHPTDVINSGEGTCLSFDRIWSPEKTFTDPCPPGYKVADFETFYEGIFNAKTNTYNLTEEDYYCSIGSPYVSPVTYFPKWSNDGIEGVWTTRYYKTDWIDMRIYACPPSSFGLLRERYTTDMRPVRCQRENTGTPMEYIDLSANGTANSYIAKPGRKYKFNATVKGNSNEAVGTPSTARVAWQTYNTDNVDGISYTSLLVGTYSVEYKDGYIYFETAPDQSRNGNVLIVLYDDCDRVIWSWHIWITEYEPDNQYVVVDGGTANPELKMMDRNLGSLSNGKHVGTGLGLLYQWGRKDPFFGPFEYTSPSIVSYRQESEKFELLADNRTATTGTVSYATYHPTHFIYRGGEDDGNWLNESVAGLWGEEKTMYDPCPPGWKVPIAPHWNSAKTAIGTFEIGLSTTAKDKNGTETTVWYPASGYLNGNSKNIDQVGFEGHYWYASPRDAGTAYSFKFDKDNIILNSNYDEKAQGNSVRCVKDE